MGIHSAIMPMEDSKSRILHKARFAATISASRILGISGFAEVTIASLSIKLQQRVPSRTRVEKVNSSVYGLIGIASFNLNGAMPIGSVKLKFIIGKWSSNRFNNHKGIYSLRKFLLLMHSIK